MKTYKCLKEVKAAKIVEIRPPFQADDPYELVFKDSSVSLVSDAWFLRHKPEVGGYFVEYDDGYKSYSPAQPFEKGYVPYEHIIEKLQYHIESVDHFLEFLDVFESSEQHEEIAEDPESRKELRAVRSALCDSKSWFSDVVRAYLDAC